MTATKSLPLDFARIRFMNALDQAIDKAGLANIKGEILDYFQADENGHFVCQSEEFSGKISYADRAEYTYDVKNRKATTLARYIRRKCDGLIVKLHLSESSIHMLSTWTHCLLVDMHDELHFELHSDVEAFYENCQATSCMTDRDAYKMAPLAAYDVCVVSATTKAGDQYRALLWTLASGERMLDRVYPTNDSIPQMLMRLWAWRRGCHVSMGSTVIDHDGERVDRADVYVENMDDVDDFDDWPYLDTLSYATVIRGGVRLGMTGDHNCGSTEGGKPWEERYSCYQCGCGCNEEDGRRDGDGDLWCEECYYENHTTCECCDQDFHDDSIQHIRIEVDGSCEIDEKRCENCVPSW